MLLINHCGCLILILSPIAQLKGFMMVFGNTVGMRLYKDVFQPLYKGRLEGWRDS